MVINITPATRQIWQETLDQLGGQARRLFMASVVAGMGRGGAAWAKRVRRQLDLPPDDN